MATRKQYVSKVAASDSAYIDPLNCESTISYKVIDGRREVWGSIQLADCNRKIEWSFFGTDAVEKLDKAIAMLTKFKETLVTARADRRKRIRTRRKSTATVKK